MSTAALDMLAAVHAMERAGMERPAAEAVAAAIRAGQGELATRDDMAALRRDMAATQAAIRGNIAATQAAIRDDMAALRRDMAAMEARIIAALYRALWMQAAGIVGALIALSGIVVAFAYLIRTAAGGGQ